MKLLLDTHILIWLAEGLDQLPEESRRRIDEAAATDGMAVSAFSFWEVAMLDMKGRIALSRPLGEWRRQVLSTPGVTEIALSGDIGIEAVQLPGEPPGDPADRILLATARLHGLQLGTRNQCLLAYGKAGHVAAIKL